VRIFVGNLPFEPLKEELQALFEKHGTVQYTAIATDSEGKERGFAFVGMESLKQAHAAIAALHGTVWNGRRLKVSEALKQPRPKAPPAKSAPSVEDAPLD
jgi:RNA recognition motif-containing protein